MKDLHDMKDWASATTKPQVALFGGLACSACFSCLRAHAGRGSSCAEATAVLAVAADFMRGNSMFPPTPVANTLLCIAPHAVALRKLSACSDI